MAESPLGVLVAGEQSSDDARQDFEKLVSLVSRGEVKGVVFPEQAIADAEAAATPPSDAVRKGAFWGACAGFLIGLVPLLASTVIGAGTGALMAKASQLRIQGGTAPRLRFAKERR
jgi:hypothetical protein